MPLTDPSQATLGNTLKVDDHEVAVVDVLTSGNGTLVVLKAADSPFCLLAHPGDLIDGENVEFVSGPSAPGQGVESVAREAAQDAEIANLRAKVEFLQSQAQQPQAPPAQPPVQEPAPEPAPATEATGATDAPADVQNVPPAGNATTVQEG